MRVCVEACRLKRPLPNQLNPGTTLFVAEFEGRIRTGDVYVFTKFGFFTPVQILLTHKKI